MRLVCMYVGKQLHGTIRNSQSAYMKCTAIITSQREAHRCGKLLSPAEHGDGVGGATKAPED
jgi:hypothetical protein